MISAFDLSTVSIFELDGLYYVDIFIEKIGETLRMSLPRLNPLNIEQAEKLNEPAKNYSLDEKLLPKFIQDNIEDLLNYEKIIDIQNGFATAYFLIN